MGAAHIARKRMTRTSAHCGEADRSGRGVVDEHREPDDAGQEDRLPAVPVAQRPGPLA